MFNNSPQQLKRYNNKRRYENLAVFLMSFEKPQKFFNKPLQMCIHLKATFSKWPQLQHSLTGCMLRSLSRSQKTIESFAATAFNEAVTFVTTHLTFKFLKVFKMKWQKNNLQIWAALWLIIIDGSQYSCIANLKSTVCRQAILTRVPLKQNQNTTDHND